MAFLESCDVKVPNASRSKPQILFIAYGGGHIAMLLPVIELTLKASFDVKVIAMTTARKVAADAGLEPIGFADLYEFAAPNAAEYGAQLCAGMIADGPVSLDESIAYHGINFAELVEDFGQAEASYLYKQHGRHAFLPKRFFTRVLAHLKPDVVVSTNSPRSERAAIEASRKLSIPALCAVDLFALQEVKWIGEKGYADKVCVLNESVRSMLISRGRKPEEVVVTGNPVFEKHVTRVARIGGASMKQERGWTGDKRTILWASQEEPAIHPFNGATGDPRLPRLIEEQLRQFVEKHDGWRLVIRYHPSEKISFVPSRNVDFSPRDEKLEYLLNAVDLVVVTASTVGLEAAILGLPVISVDCSVWMPDTLFSKQGISTGVLAIKDLPAAIIQEGMKQERKIIDVSNPLLRMPDKPAHAIFKQIVRLLGSADGP